MSARATGRRLSLDVRDPQAIPYFLWDEPMTVSELKHRLSTAPRLERLRLLGRVLREARDPDVWEFTTLREVAAEWPDLKRHLGRRLAFWEFLLEHWHQQALDGAR